ncbi:SAM-dependent methyltransferase, partial [Nocardia gipuzkoensis]|uniref:SAM-dependent methyltransferase n=1 Tax=Nocardia gipuzkoensis TaxID=2749991 RepID=UPI00237D5CFE
MKLLPQTGVRAPVGVDTTRAGIARVYDAALGGKDNYEVDRYVRDKVAEVAPRQSDVAWMNCRWLHRVVRYRHLEPLYITVFDRTRRGGTGLPAPATRVARLP